MKDDFTVAGRNKSGHKSYLVAAKPMLTVDVERYQAYLDDPGLSNEQKQEFLHALWSIIVTFVDLGFGVHPVQEVCGKDAQNGSDSIKQEFDAVSCDSSEEDKKIDGFSP
ncbi:MAG: hypothetical protein WDA25_06685 [Paracoccaceae bacterium]